MKNRFWPGVFLGIAMGAGAGILVTALMLFGGGAGIRQGASSGEELIGIMRKVSLLEKYIDAYYLNGTAEAEMDEGIYKGLLESLEDPYSTYYTKEEYEELLETTSGTYCGIGMTVSQDAATGVITVVEPYEGGPAAEAGIRPQDVIYKVGGIEVTGEDLSYVVSMIKGEEGTDIDVTILRGLDEIDVTLTRRKVEVSTVSYEMLDGGIGRINVSSFDEVTGKQFRDALDDLEGQGEEGLIIDLRGNGGGSLDTVVDMLDRMLPEGVIVSTKTREGKGETYYSTEEEKFEKPLAVLINGSSASASEVFAGAIQDYGMGKLVGTTSFGKGIVQTVFALEDGSAVKLTTSEYFTPKGRNIQGIGLSPDVEAELPRELAVKPDLEDEEDTQLQAAISELSKEIGEEG